MLPEKRHSTVFVAPGKTYKQTIDDRDELIWSQLECITVAQAGAAFLDSIPNPHTRRSYQTGLDQLATHGLIDPTESLQSFALRNHQATLDQIKAMDGLSEGTRQVRAAIYCAFSRFLSRRTDGMIRRVIPSREGTTRTFFKVRDTVATDAMDRAQWMRWLDHLGKINTRDALIAKLLLQGGKRISEALSLETSAINWDERQITYRQAKAKGTIRETIITHPVHVMDELRSYIGGRSGLVFITGTGGPVHPTQLNRNFAVAGERAGIPFKVTPHVLRASTVTYLRREGFATLDIQRVTGHADPSMVAAYDKNGREKNASQKVSLV